MVSGWQSHIAGVDVTCQWVAAAATAAAAIGDAVQSTRCLGLYRTDTD